MKCIKCKKKAFIKLEYANSAFCREHFLEFFERRVKRTIKRYDMVRKGDKVLVGVSGGKDSVVLLHVLSKLSEELEFEVEALTIDLGISGYSSAYVKIAEEVSKGAGVKLHVLSLKEEHGFEMDEAAMRLSRNPCSTCGVVKRYLLNKYAFEHGFDRVATGHNLDDVVAFVISGYLRGDVEGLTRLYPKSETVGKMVSRIKPLVETPEGEVPVYAYLRGLKFVEQPCPYSKGDPNALIKKLVLELEREMPGIRYMILRGFTDRMHPILAKELPERSYEECSVCGMPSSGRLCAFCKIKKRLADAKKKKGDFSRAS